MRIIWLCNIVLPELENVFNFKKSNSGGWLSGMWEEVISQDSLEMGICVPIRNKKRAKNGRYQNYKYYSFITISNESNTTIDNQIIRFMEILEDFKPDLIHIWGTEFEHSFSMVEAAKKLGLQKKIIVNIQGLITYCAKVYNIGIPDNVFDARDIWGNSISDGKQQFEKREIYEKETIENVNNIIGRTEWDKRCVKQINNKINYFHCGEVLRKNFYLANKWSYDSCNKHSIFISQASYPIKGLHLVIDEFSFLKKRYDDLQVRIAGNNLMESNNPYAVFIQEKIKERKLEDTICFLGNLNEEHMIEQYLNANAFLSMSLIENSSNSICEAMMLGVPVVASKVGGTGSLIEHKKSGFLYSLMEPNTMSSYIVDIFENVDNVGKISKESIEKAEKFNSKTEALNALLSIYNNVSNA